MSEDEKKEKKGKPLFLIIIIMFVLILLLAAGFGYLILNKGDDTADKTKVVETNTVQVPEFIYSFEDEFLINLADTESKRLLKAKISLGYSNKKLDTELKTKDPVIRDAINSVIRGKQAADLTTKGTEDMKNQLKDRINPLLKEGKISDVYFNDFLVN